MKDMNPQGNTQKSFDDKWTMNPNAFFDETLTEGTETQNWILNRNGFRDLQAFAKHLSVCKRILDAGCGNGRVTALLRQITQEDVRIVGIDLVAADVARNNLKYSENIQFFTTDLLSDLSELGKFDFIYCQEVLHHTINPRQAFLNLVNLLSSGGEIAIYVYKKKAPVREFVDDYVRDRISLMKYDEAMLHCRQLTLLGKALADLKIKIDVPKVSALEIEEGEFDIQRFIYHFFAKLYWNPGLSFEENAIVNYDWYHPKTASRHTLEEVLEWFNYAGLSVVHQNTDFYGITIRGLLPLELA